MIFALHSPTQGIAAELAAAKQRIAELEAENARLRANFSELISRLDRQAVEVA